MQWPWAMTAAGTGQGSRMLTGHRTPILMTYDANDCLVKEHHTIPGGSKENLWQDVEKLGRTELMDAVPVTLGEEFEAYAQALARDRWRLYKVEERLRQVNIGGTAVGLSTNADRKYRFGVIEELRRLTGYGLAAAHGEFELNAFMPLIADSLLESLELMTSSVQLFREKCIEPLQVNEMNCRKYLEASSAFAASYVPALGYDQVSRIIRDCSPEEAVKELKKCLEQKE